MTVDESRFRECIIRSLRLRSGEYRPDLRIGDVEQWDSVAHLDVLSDLEKEFGVRFGLDDMATLTSLPELRNWLERTG
ncbi:MAG TPA: acyl carrier protein [Steroidobacteraceae bacterium]|jgi:acyl carrier protein|nr:acyl carrier protein [Steroidobacteraceae bacterium]